jgi:predicted Zn-dependent protease
MIQLCRVSQRCQELAAFGRRPAPLGTDKLRLVTGTMLAVVMRLGLASSVLAQGTAVATQSSPGAAAELAVQRARDHIHLGLDLASRQAVYSAQQEFVAALRVIATQWDIAAGTRAHEEALETALKTLNSLAPPSAQNGPPGAAASQLSVIAALQQQLLVIQQRLVFAVGHEPTASMALYLLGRSQAATAGETAQEKVLAGPKAIAMYQAALAVDPADYLAANELGALLARYGQFEDAQAILSHGVSVAQQPALWHNLAVVYEKMGNTAAAQQARAQCDALTAAQGKGKTAQPQNAAASVRWTEPAEFIRCSATDDYDSPSAQRSVAGEQRAPQPQPAVASKPAPRQDAASSLPQWMTSGLKTLTGR